MSLLLKQPLAWHNEAWQQVLQQIRSNKLPHALLVCADSDTGKRHFATLLGQYLLCEHPAGDAPCGECSKCLLNAAGTHPDLKLIEAEEGSRVIKVDQVRELRNFVESTSHADGYRIVILDPAETLNISGANALLKSLEEPPARVLFLLLSDRPKALLPTIASRSQVLRLPPPTRVESLAWLANHTRSDFESLEKLLTLAQERPLLALSLHQQGLLEQLQDIDVAMLELLTGRRLPSVLAATYAKQGGNETLPLLVSWTASVSRFLMSGQPRFLASDPQREAARLLGHGDARQQTQRLFTLYTDISNTQQQISNGGNPNLQLLLEDIFIRIQRLARGGSDGTGNTQHRAG